MKRQHIGPLLFLVVLQLLACGGCSSPPPTAFPSRKEPKRIAVRNNSGKPVQSIVIQEDIDAAEGVRRMGSMSPAAEYHTYVFVRPDDAAPLPSKLRVTWTVPGGPPQSKAVNLYPLAKNTSGDENEAVVFELRPGGWVGVSLENLQP